MLDLQHIHVTFHHGTVHEHKALDDVCLQLHDEDFLCILGGNGAGKSTLMNIISGSIQPDQGSVHLHGQDITKSPEYQRSTMIGRLFQDPLKGTASHMSVLENLSLAYGRSKRHMLQKAIHKEDIAYFKTRLEALHLGLEDRLHHEVGLLSGGQRQALTLLMATLVPPKLLLLDEHTAALDPKTADVIMEETDHIIKEYQIPTIMITHNLRQALQYGNRLIVMKDGRILKDMKQEEKAKTTIEELLKLFEMY